MEDSCERKTSNKNVISVNTPNMIQRVSSFLTSHVLMGQHVCTRVYNSVYLRIMIYLRIVVLCVLRIVVNFRRVL